MIITKITSCENSKISAGLLMYYRRDTGLEFLLAHPGGPYFANKDQNAWSIPKGLAKENEEIFAAGMREFVEETGIVPYPEIFIPLGSITQKSGKNVYAWAFESNLFSLPKNKSNTCIIEYPRGSGQEIEIPEVDKIEWFSEEIVKEKIYLAQYAFIERLKEILR